MNRRNALPWILALAALVAATGCCNSIACQVKDLAATELACGQDELTVRNLSYENGAVPGDPTRTIAVEGCGRTAQYTCLPQEDTGGNSRLRDPSRKALDREWTCQPAATPVAARAENR